MEHILQTALGWIVDCSHRFHETQTELLTLRQLISDSNKQNELLSSELAGARNKLSQSVAKEEFYRGQALKMNLVPPRRRLRFAGPDHENSLTPEQLSQQVLNQSDALAARDHEIQRLQSIETDLDRLIETSTDQVADRLRALEKQVASCVAIHEAKAPRTPAPASDDEDEDEDEDELFPSASLVLERYKASLVLERYHATVASLNERLETLASPRPLRLTPRADAFAPRAGAHTPRADAYTPRGGGVDASTPRSACTTMSGASPPLSSRDPGPRAARAPPDPADALPAPSWAAFAPTEPVVSNPRLRRRLDPGNPLW